LYIKIFYRVICQNKIHLEIYMNFTEEKIQLLKLANEQMNINESDQRKTIIFIYCPPKVGSTTLVTSFRLSSINSYIFHIHDETMLNVICGVKDVTINEIIQYNKYLGRNVYVIDVYRSPIEHKISQFFENISNFHFNNTNENVNQYDVERVIYRFNKLFPHLTSKDYYREVYNIPIFETFDYDKGYMIQETNGIIYIKLRLVDSEKWSTTMKNIFGTDIFIIKDYETDKKEIRDIYRKFKNDYRLPAQYFEMIKTDTNLFYYFSEVERNNYLDEWRNKLSYSFVIPYTKEEYIFYKTLSCENQIYNAIQRNHYLDFGCVCVACSFKREKVLEKIKQGETEIEPINHVVATQEYALEINKKKKKLVEMISKKMEERKKEKKTPKQIIGGKFMSNIHGR